MKLFRDEIEKYNNVYPVAIKFFKRRLDNIHNKQRLETNTLVQENVQNTNKFIGHEIRKKYLPFLDGLVK